jgi:transcriptional regulator with XRE-family HTH domain
MQAIEIAQVVKLCVIGSEHREPMTLGKRIRVARDRLGITQQVLADHFGITAAVSGWERDQAILEFGHLRKLPRFLKHRPIGYFVGMIRLKMRSTPYGAAWTRAGEGKHCVFSRV